MRLSAQLLTQLVQALQQPSRLGRFPAALWRHILARGWAYSNEIEDLVLDLDRRLYGIDLDALARQTEFPFRYVRDRPRFVTAEWIAMPGHGRQRRRSTVHL